MISVVSAIRIFFQGRRPRSILNFSTFPKWLRIFHDEQSTLPFPACIILPKALLKTIGKSQTKINKVTVKMYNMLCN